MTNAIPDDAAARLDRLLDDAYRPRRNRPARYSPTHAKRWLGYLAVHLTRYPGMGIDPGTLRSRTRSYSLVNGLTRGGFIGFVVPMVVLLAILGLFLVQSNSKPDPTSFTPNTDPIKHHFLDGPLGPVYWLVSRILLFYRNTLWAPLSGGDALATDWDWLLSVVCLVVTARLILLPLVVKQVQSLHRMREIQPRVRELQQRHRGDRETLQQELMHLYREEKANPLMGCLPMVVQVPMFFGLYHVISRLDPTATEEEAARFGWTAAEFHDAATARVLGAPIVETFGADGNLHVLLVVGLLVLVWMAISYRNAFESLVGKGGWSPDSQQRLIQRAIIFGLPAVQPAMVLFVPAGAVVYLLAQTCFTLAQQRWIDRRYPQPRQPVTSHEPPDGTFGMTALLSFGAVAMLTYPVGALALSGGVRGLVLLGGILAVLATLIGLREGLAAHGGGAGPITARRFLNDACDRRILRRPRRGRYQFRQDWVRDQLAISYRRAATRYRQAHPMPRQRPAGNGATAAYATGRLMGPDEWAMTGAEQLEEFF